MEKEVTVCNHTLGELFSKNLAIPGYQRIYCWQEKNVERLLDDIWTLEEKQVYHLGSVILQKDEVLSMEILRQSVDARKKQELFYVYNVALQLRDKEDLILKRN